MTRRLECWSETYRRLVANGWDHGAAAYQADENAKAQARRAAARAEALRAREALYGACLKKRPVPADAPQGGVTAHAPREDQ